MCCISSSVRSVFFLNLPCDVFSFIAAFAYIILTGNLSDSGLKPPPDDFERSRSKSSQPRLSLGGAIKHIFVVISSVTVTSLYSSGATSNCIAGYLVSSFSSSISLIVTDEFICYCILDFMAENVMVGRKLVGFGLDITVATFIFLAKFRISFTLIVKADFSAVLVCKHDSKLVEMAAVVAF